VEKKRYTATIGGATFVVNLLAPAFVAIGERILPNPPVHPLTVLAAISIVYALGEGVGRLACISFGCCYGKPLAESHPLLRKLFARWNFTFSGPTKKIAYAHGLDGQAVIPIQGVTSLLYSAVSLLGIFLFLKRWYGAAFLLCLLITQVWRVVSEFFRADYRGGGSISAYQVMAFLSIAYGVLLVAILPPPPVSSHNLWAGLHSLFSSGMILFLQTLWVAAFLFTGRSSVTASTISFHVVKERV
jgi:prolipoprotein diacylglyceryltransferase